MQEPTDDLRISALQSLVKPNHLLQSLPLPRLLASQIQQARQSIANIIQGNDPRLLVVVGPCSIHDNKAALDYAYQLKQAAKQFQNELLIVMRVYFEKPRTIVGWKGLISDPKLDGSFDINNGLLLARKLLLDIAELGLPAATEFLDTIIPQYLSDLISWSAIGARTTQSQIHRELASGLSMPVGFKNTTDGNIKIAIDAVNAARYSHHFLGISKEGDPAIISTKGNPQAHIILRGGSNAVNYTRKTIEETANALIEAHLTPRLMVDCSHGNSMKDHRRQKDVVNAIADQLKEGATEICGVMLESNLTAGKQTLKAGEPLVYGQSITDACLSWEETLPLLEQLATTLRTQSTQTRLPSADHSV